MFSKQFDRRVRVALIVVVLSLVSGVAFGFYVLWPSNMETGYQPSQPIAFSHKRHAGELQIPCLYCHSGAATGAQATLPDLATCMNCHSQVKPTTASGELHPGVATLLDHWDRREPILWNKVNDVADFVYFNHSRHIRAGIECAECHGQVEKRDRMRREHSLKMRWCLSCHKQDRQPDQTVSMPGQITRAPIFCNTCHR